MKSTPRAGVGGLSDYWLAHADEKILIPMYGQADSLNVSAAATLVLYEAARQRRAKGMLPKE